MPIISAPLATPQIQTSIPVAAFVPSVVTPSYMPASGPLSQPGIPAGLPGSGSNFNDTAPAQAPVPAPKTGNSTMLILVAAGLGALLLLGRKKGH